MGWYDGTEADYLDDGGDYVDYESMEYERRQEIIEDRNRRERELIGKYLVVVTARYQKDVDLFLQDGRYGSGYWTRFKSNAKGFSDESAAVVKARNLQYNNPRVVLVQRNGTFKEVYKNGKRLSNWR